MTISVAEILPSQIFEVIVAKISQRVTRLPKHTVVRYAKRNSLVILTPGLRIADRARVVPHRFGVPGQEGKSWPTKFRRKDGRRDGRQVCTVPIDGRGHSTGTRKGSQKFFGGLRKTNGLVIHL